MFKLCEKLKIKKVLIKLTCLSSIFQFSFNPNAFETGQWLMALISRSKLQRCLGAENPVHLLNHFSLHAFPTFLCTRQRDRYRWSLPHTRPYGLLVNEACVTRNWPKTELFIFISQTYPSVEQFGPIRLLLLFHTSKGCEDVSLPFPFYAGLGRQKFPSWNRFWNSYVYCVAVTPFFAFCRYSL